MIVEQFFQVPQPALTSTKREKQLLSAFIELTQHHIDRCPPYAKIARLTAPDFKRAKTLADLPYLPASLFKTHRLQSAPDKDIRTILTSSGTSGRPVSRIPIDDMTARYQAQALSSVVSPILGKARLPMLIIDQESTIKRGSTLNARSAGILGMMLHGHAHSFALDDQMQLQEKPVGDFLQKYGQAPFLIFGFTFMIWHYFYKALVGKNIDLTQAILIHGGGWKKLEAESVSNHQFKAQLNEAFGLTKINNFYGMVEQMGTSFLEGDDGYLRPPAFGDVIVRDPATWRPVPDGQEGVIQTLSLIPHSYPGHSLLTEDRGMIVKTSLAGKALNVLGRMPQAELRGCSDVHAYGSAV